MMRAAGGGGRGKIEETSREEFWAEEFRFIYIVQQRAEAFHV